MCTCDLPETNVEKAVRRLVRNSRLSFRGHRGFSKSVVIVHVILQLHAKRYKIQKAVIHLFLRDQLLESSVTSVTVQCGCLDLRLTPGKNVRGPHTWPRPCLVFSSGPYNVLQLLAATLEPSCFQFIIHLMVMKFSSVSLFCFYYWYFLFYAVIFMAN